MKTLCTAFIVLCMITTTGLHQLSAQCEKTFHFINNTGRDVTDLHIEFKDEGATLIEHNFPGWSSSKPAIYEGPKTNGTKKRWDIKEGILPNKRIVTLSFRSDSCQLHIANWYWTVDDEDADTPYNGDIRRGTDTLDNDNIRGLDSMLIGPADRVSKLKLKHNHKDSDGNDYRVNDLHIVTRTRPQILNQNREEEGGDTKVDDVFEESNIIECNCAMEPSQSPCKEVCKDTNGVYRNETLYIIQLATSSSIPTDTEIELELKNVKPNDALWHWWTQDGKPIKVHQRNGNSYTNPHSREKGVEENRNGAQPTDATPKDDWTTISYIPDFPSTSGGHSYYAIGLGGGISNTTFSSANHFGQEQMDPLIMSLYEDPNLFEQLFEKLGGEFFIGSFSEAPRFENISYTAQTNYGIHLQYGFSSNIAIEALLSRVQARGTASFPVMVIENQSGETQSILGQYEVQQQGWQSQLGLQYLVGDGPLQAFAGAYVGLRQMDQETEAQIENISWMLSQSKETSFGYGFQVGGRHLTPSGIFLDVRLQTADFGKAFQWGSQATVGFQF